MELADWDRVKAITLETANRYSLTLTVFDSVRREPKLATGTIVITNAGPCLITAGHVISHFLNLGSRGRLQIGRDRYVVSNIPIERISVGRQVDIASIKLTAKEAEEMEQAMLSWDNVGLDCVVVGTLIAFVGYPGSWKHWQSTGSIGIGSYEFFGFVQTVQSDQFSVRVDEEHDIVVKTNRDPLSFQGFQEIGGLSGAPIFQAADRPKLVGIVSEGNAWSEKEQKIYAVHTSVIDQNGRITV